MVVGKFYENSAYATKMLLLGLAIIKPVLHSSRYIKTIHALTNGSSSQGLFGCRACMTFLHTPTHQSMRQSSSTAMDVATAQLLEGVTHGNRVALSKVLTLCESSHPTHQAQALNLLGGLASFVAARRASNAKAPSTASGSTPPSAPAAEAVGSAAVANASVPPNAYSSSQSSESAVYAARPMSRQAQNSPPTSSSSSSSSQGAYQTGINGPIRDQALRLGISGPPGAGKSCLIDSLGLYLCEHGARVAVLAVDPSSHQSGGAILGDKTRMARLSNHPNAYVRPSAARGTLGGVAKATADALLVCEAAGYDTLMVETVGVGQSETAVSSLVDCMVLVMSPVAGDALQMVKRGIMETADIVVVNKADGPTEDAALRTVADYANTLNLLPRRRRSWRPVALPVSARTRHNIPKLATLISQFEAALSASGELHAARIAALEQTVWQAAEDAVIDELHRSSSVQRALRELLPRVRAGDLLTRQAARLLVQSLVAGSEGCDHGKS